MIGDAPVPAIKRDWLNPVAGGAGAPHMTWRDFDDALGRQTASTFILYKYLSHIHPNKHDSVNFVHAVTSRKSAANTVGL